MKSEIHQRSACDEDRDFLFRLYADVRGPEIDAWGWPEGQRAMFLQMQFEAQRRFYSGGYPDARDQLICVEDELIGRLLTAKMADGMHLIDMALLSPYRGQGIGSELIRELQRECEGTGIPLRLQVLRGNPAEHLYRRLGFEEAGADQMYIQMQWTPRAGGSS